MSVEKFSGSELSWAQVFDSLRSFNLFCKQKVIVINDADKAIKKEKDSAKLFKNLNQGAHYVVLQSEQAKPKKWTYEFWNAPSTQNLPTDDKAVFRWVDAIHSENLKRAIRELETALDQGTHPLVLLQLLTRHYRTGRLIHHAVEKRLSNAEILTCLKVPPFVVQKWKKSKRFSKKQWQLLFERLYKCDLELKSGGNDYWSLRKLSVDLIQSNLKLQSITKNNFVMTPASLFEQSLWKVSPSFC